MNVAYWNVQDNHHGPMYDNEVPCHSGIAQEVILVDKDAPPLPLRQGCNSSPLSYSSTTPLIPIVKVPSTSPLSSNESQVQASCCLYPITSYISILC